MSVRAENSGWLAVLKWRGKYHSSKWFRAKRDAVAWEQRQRSLLEGGVDPRAGKTLLGDLLAEFIEHRETAVAFKTVQADRNLLIWVPETLRKIGVAQVTPGMIADAFNDLARADKARSSIERFKGTLSAFFTWCMQHGYVERNPVRGVRVPSTARAPAEMKPFPADEFDQRMAVWRSLDTEAAATIDFLAASGLRWEEARVIQVHDLLRVPYPAVLIRRAQPEGAPMGPTKTRRSRRVPLPDDVFAWLEDMAASKSDTDFLLPMRTGKAMLKRLDWEHTGGGRTLRDLRHTAITNWLGPMSVDAATVRHWAGHASLSTTSRYSHWLGVDSDRAAIERINNSRASRGQVNERRDAHQ